MYGSKNVREIDKRRYGKKNARKTDNYNWFERSYPRGAAWQFSVMIGGWERFCVMILVELAVLNDDF